jgi:hypothetical protein
LDRSEKNRTIGFERSLTPFIAVATCDAVRIEMGIEGYRYITHRIAVEGGELAW